MGDDRLTALTSNSLPVLVLCGIALYVGLVNFLFYLYPKKDRERSQLYFSLVCLTVALYDFFSFLGYNVAGPLEAMRWQRLQLFVTPLLAAAVVQLITDLVGVERHRRFVRGLVWTYVVISLVVLVPDSVLFSADQGSTRVLRFFGWTVTYHEMPLGPLAQLTVLCFIAGIGYGFYCLVRAYRTGRTRETGLLIAAFGLFFVAAFVDILNALQALSFFYTLEYAYLGLVLLMDYSLVKRFADQQNHIRVMNIELSQAVEEARESARLKGELLSRTSHEMRTPLNSIINIPENLIQEFADREVLKCKACQALYEWSEESAADPVVKCDSCAATGTLQRTRICIYQGDLAECRHYLGVVLKAGRHLLAVVNDVLDMSKIEAGRIELSCEQVELGKLVQNVIEATTHLGRERQIEIVLQLDQAPLLLEADPLRVTQILFNLVGNAIKFSRDGGQVTVAAEHLPSDRIRIAVKDRGIGISREDQDHIFSSYFQGHSDPARSQQGTGLGLTITKKLVELHGGEIWVESEPGQGTTIFVSLPTKQPGPKAIPAS